MDSCAVLSTKDPGLIRPIERTLREFRVLRAIPGTRRVNRSRVGNRHPFFQNQWPVPHVSGGEKPATGKPFRFSAGQLGNAHGSAPCLSLNFRRDTLTDEDRPSRTTCPKRQPGLAYLPDSWTHARERGLGPVASDRTIRGIGRGNAGALSVLLDSELA